MHEIIVDPGNFHRVFYCIVFDRLVVGNIILAATENSNEIVILAH